MSPAFAGRFFTTSATWEAPLHLWATYKGMCGNGIHGKYTGITLPLLFVVHSLSHVRLSATPWIAAPQDIYPSLPPRVCSHSCPLSWCCYLILCRSLLLSHSVFPSIRVFTSESVLHIRWPNIGASASASVLPVNIQSWFPLGINWFDLLEVQGLSQFFSSNTVKNISSSALSLLYGPSPTSVHDYWKSHHCCCSVTQSCATLCNLMDCSTPWNEDACSLEQKLWPT